MHDENLQQSLNISMLLENITLARYVRPYLNKLLAFLLPAEQHLQCRSKHIICNYLTPNPLCPLPLIPPQIYEQ